jgi:hypothetical protein
MNEEDEEEVDEERYVPAYGEKEKRWREQKGDFLLLLLNMSVMRSTKEAFLQDAVSSMLSR